MHELEGDDYEIVSGHHRAKDTDPATKLIAADFNAAWFELLNVVLRSGQSLAADATADQTAGWKQIANAIAEINDDLTFKTAAVRLYEPGGGHASFNIRYARHALRKLTTIEFPDGSLTATGSGSTWNLLMDDDSNLPSYLLPSTERIFFPIPNAQKNGAPITANMVKALADSYYTFGFGAAANTDVFSWSGFTVTLLNAA